MRFLKCYYSYAVKHSYSLEMDSVNTGVRQGISIHLQMVK